MAEDKPIIVIKKKGGHGGHHGGAWKVAYADFVTAMMCFFMVMWLINSADAPTRKNIAQYFLSRPGFFEAGSGTPISIGASGILKEGFPPAQKHTRKYASGEDQAPMKKKSGAEDADLENTGTKSTQLAITPIAITPVQGLPTLSPEQLTQLRMGQPPGGAETPKELLEKVAQQIKRQIAASPELKELLGVVDVKVDADGLNIDIMDTEKTSMFKLGSPRIEEEAAAAFAKIGGILSKVPNHIDIVGHTDAKPFASRAGGYTNWELSADRANAARRLLEKSGISPDRITSVLGRADRELKNPNDPFAASNRRITLKMRFPVNQDIDLSKNPAALEELPAPEVTQAGAAPVETVHAMTPREILERRRAAAGTPIALPDEPPRTTNPDYMEKDKIFPQNPVLGPPSPFSNF